MALLPAIEAKPNKIWIKSINYTCLTDILRIPWQKSKDLEKGKVFVFGIEVDMNLFTMFFSCNKLHKESGLAITELDKKSIIMLEAKTLTGFLTFCVKVLRLACIFTQILWDFVTNFPLGYQASFEKFLDRFVTICHSETTC